MVVGGEHKGEPGAVAVDPRFANEIHDMRMQLYDFSIHALETGVSGDHLDVAKRVLNGMAQSPGLRFRQSDLIKLVLPKPAEGDLVARDEWSKEAGIIDELVEQLADPDSPLAPISGYWRSEGEPGSDEYLAWFDHEGSLALGRFEPMVRFYARMRRPKVNKPVPIIDVEKVPIDEALSSLSLQRLAIAFTFLHGGEVPLTVTRLRDVKVALTHLAKAELRPDDERRFVGLARRVSAFQLRLNGELAEGDEVTQRYEAFLDEKIRAPKQDDGIVTVDPGFDKTRGRCNQPDISPAVRLAFIGGEASIPDREEAAAVCYKNCPFLFKCMLYGMKSDAIGWGISGLDEDGNVLGTQAAKAAGVYGGTLPSDRRDIRNLILGGDLKGAESAYQAIVEERNPVKKRPKNSAAQTRKKQPGETRLAN